jgi:pyridoxamine 5'-phosphate oxidase
VEFWQGRQHRLHDRFQYERTGDVWTIRRLSP